MARVLTVTLLTLMVTVTPVQAQRTIVFIVAGQSNAVGGNPASTLPRELAGEQADVLYAYWLPDITVPQSSGWETLRPLGPGIGSTFGPELSFGRRLADSLGATVAIIKAADNGSSLCCQWLPSLDLLYPQMIEFVEARLAELVDAGHEVEMGGVLWVQGATDTLAEPTGLAYGENLELLSAALNADLGLAPFIQSQQPSFTATADGCRDTPGLDGVRAGKVAFSASHPTAELLDTEDLTLRPDDCSHYDTPSTLTIGDRAAAAILHQRADVDDDGAVGVEDLLQIIANWGLDDDDPSGDGVVGVADLLMVLTNWGE